jgi:hypothetical protein
LWGANFFVPHPPPPGVSVTAESKGLAAISLGSAESKALMKLSDLTNLQEFGAYLKDSNGFR